MENLYNIIDKNTKKKKEHTKGFEKCDLKPNIKM